MDSTDANSRPIISVRGPGADWLWAVGCGTATTLLAAVISTRVFERIPHVEDSIAQLFQARIFASGHLWVPSPSLREFFDYTHVVNDGHWYAVYPPGHSLLLAVGVWFGHPWLVNPVLGGLAVAAIYFLALETTDRPTARLAALLGTLSPFLVLMASEYMSHVSALLLLTMYLLLQLRTLRTADPRSGFGAGACLGAAVLVRPYSAIGVALPIVLHSVWRLRREPERLRIALLAGLAGPAAGVALWLGYNSATTGEATTPGYIRLYGPQHGIGFGKGAWGEPHTPYRGVVAAIVNGIALNQMLFAWPLSSLWPALVATMAMVLRWRARLLATISPAGGAIVQATGAPPGLLLAVPVSLQGVHIFYWFHDLCFGPRFLYEALGPILVLSAWGFRWVALRLGAWLLPHARGPGRTIPGLLVGIALFLYAALSGWPALFRPPTTLDALPAGDPARIQSYFQVFGPSYWGVNAYLGRLVRERDLRQALVFTRFVEPPPLTPAMRHLWFGSAFAHQDPDPDRAPVIYAQDLGAHDAELMALYPHRRAYLYVGSITRGTLVELARPHNP